VTLLLSLRRISHSASLRATGSEIVAWACVASSALRLRRSSMTFSSASLSGCEVVEVAATAAGVIGLRAETDGARGGGPSGVADGAVAT
jgi:hypothetical protein